MKRKRVIAGILLVGIFAGTRTGCKNTAVSKKETWAIRWTLSRSTGEGHS